MQGQRQRENERLREEGGRGGEQERRKEELDCIIDYPITSTALRNYPPLLGGLSHIQSAPELQIHARLRTEDGEWPSEERRRMAKSPVKSRENCTKQASEDTLRATAMYHERRSILLLLLHACNIAA